MPEYFYKHPKKEIYVSVIQTMSEDHVYFDKNGLKWERIFTVPQAVVKTALDPHNPRHFVEKTAGMKGSLGDLTDLSQELSEKRKRESDDGRDKHQDSYFDKWSESRQGRRHPDDTRPKKKTEKRNRKKQKK